MPVVSVSTDCELRPRAARNVLVSGAAVLLLLLWPALVNRYPLVFSDTGTYVSQIVERHLGWDRPVFYSLMILPLHLTLTLWPVIVAQAALTLCVLKIAMRCFAGSARQLPAILLVLAAGTSLPWVTAQIMPDFTTGLLALLLAMLVIVPERLGLRLALFTAATATALIAMHQANVPLSLMLLVVLLPLRRRLGAAAALGRLGVLLACGPLIAATLALMAVNAVGHGRFSPSPYGNIFVLARSLSDGPAMDALRRHCPRAGWRLCVLVQEGQPRDPDAFLWHADSALYREGGPKVISAEANAILLTALRDEPGAVLWAALRDSVRQFGMVATGDGLDPWPQTVTPVIRRDFPSAELHRYQRAVQTREGLVLPRWLRTIHATLLAFGIVATVLWLLLGLRRRHPIAGLCAATLLCLVGNAAITGALSGPHDRYQARIGWLPVFTPLVAAVALRRRGDVTAGLNPSPGRVPAHVAAPTAWSG
ncbi:MAG TPA: hypothetical protein VFN42_02510 [Acetobacteraceae bacterium]|nr:hypothetical protein [Acetobacteraceae bacterium]